MKTFILLVCAFILLGCNKTQTENQTLSETSVYNSLHGSAIQYSAAELETIKKSGHPFAVFVSANWCPGCVKLSQEISENQTLIPKDAAILIADFDTDTKLNKTYQVTSKHTGIFFDDNGNHLNTKAGVNFDDFMNHLNQYQ